MAKDISLIGRRITAVRAMTAPEAAAEGWTFDMHGPPAVLVLDDGTRIYASRDSEGNGCGRLFGAALGGATFYLNPA